MLTAVGKVTGVGTQASSVQSAEIKLRNNPNKMTNDVLEQVQKLVFLSTETCSDKCKSEQYKPGFLRNKTRHLTFSLIVRCGPMILTMCLQRESKEHLRPPHLQ